MRFATPLALVASSLFAAARAQNCTNDGGNWYCDLVDGIQYSNFGGSGTYQKVVDMDEDTGACTFAPRNYQGILAPFNEQLSIHIRGPFNLKQFAWYKPLLNVNQRRKRRSRSDFEEDQYDNDDDEEGQDQLAPRQLSAATWTRRGYYSSTAGTAQNITFLNNMGGGAYPGIWSDTFGNSLGYASATGTEPAMEPTVLADTVLPSVSEISLWTNKQCGVDGPCPYWRPDSVAYHGFGGRNKLFLFEFAMPHAAGQDMPALWFLNARIPRTQQYGACSCWGNTLGCGELDAFEVLAPGDERMISAVHGVQAATDPYYFARPSTGGVTIKTAVAMSQSRVVLQVLPDDTDFDAALDPETVAGLFALPSNSNVFTLS